MSKTPISSATPNAVVYRIKDVEVAPLHLPSITGLSNVEPSDFMQALQPLEKLVPGLHSHAKRAMERAARCSGEVDAEGKALVDALSADEMAAVSVFAAGWPDLRLSLFARLNTALRERNRAALAPWLGLACFCCFLLVLC